MKKRIISTTRNTITEYHVFNGCGEILELDLWKSGPNVIIADNGAVQAQSVKVDALAGSIDLLGIMQIDGGEQSKSANHLFRIISFFQETGLPKHGRVIAIGGGAVCDVVSVASQLFRRGVSLVLVPTTLLSQVDAAIGGKNGINFGSTKNLIGSFNHPEAVLCDTDFLSTLDNLNTICGIAECLKVFAAAGDRNLLRFFLHHPKKITDFSNADLQDLIRLAVNHKLNLLSEDPFENSSRRLLNYGHAFAHSFEEQSEFRLSHGEAVLIGMTIENAISKRLGIAGDELIKLQTIIESYLTQRCREFWIPVEKVLQILKELRAARRGKLNIVCIESFGKATIVDDVNDEILLGAWEDARLILEAAVC